MIYAYGGSDTDSYMIPNSEGDDEGGDNQYFSNSGGQGREYNLRYLESNIDFPPEHDINPIDMYEINKRIFTIFSIILIILNTLCSYVALSTTKSVLANIMMTSSVTSVPSGFIVFINT
mmetsp:Transcript_28046/g.27885  ORF Transcript_28046/g.27885 Transcript_28046/m.27885 type:complete len:119 (+) Transcript_28046:89-445(+)